MSSREQYRGVFLPGCTLDDRLWHQALVTNRFMTERRGFGVRRPDEERALFHLIEDGIVDASELDNPMPSSTRSMRYTAVMADRLWSIIEREKKRVSSWLSCWGLGLICRHRETALSGS
jgi:hypothetical protein